MKERLKKLWNEVVPGGGPCPQPEARDVMLRVDAALREESGKKRRSFRPARLAVTAAVLAALLLTGSVLAASDILPPEFNVLSQQFRRGENAANAIAMMTIDPVSVSDGSYDMTVTSSLADGQKLYFTLIIEAKTDEALEALKAQDDLLSYRLFGSNSASHGSWFDQENDHVLYMDVSATWIPTSHAAVRLNLMEEGLWLEFPVKTVRSVTVDIHADGQGCGLAGSPAGGPVTLETVEVSPLSFALDFTTPYLEQGCPAVYFLYQDGTIKTQGQLDAVFPSGHGSQVGLFGGDQRPMRYQYSFQFPAVQDLSQMEAVIFESTAYPLDGGEPYPVDMSGYVRPFTIPAGDCLEDSPDLSVPFFALCKGLGIPYTWDEETGTASAARCGVTLTFTQGSAVMSVDGPDFQDPERELLSAPVYQGGELWVDVSPYLQSWWELGMVPASERPTVDGRGSGWHWVVLP